MDPALPVSQPLSPASPASSDLYNLLFQYAETTHGPGKATHSHFQVSLFIVDTFWTRYHSLFYTYLLSLHDSIQALPLSENHPWLSTYVSSLPLPQCLLLCIPLIKQSAHC